MKRNIKQLVKQMTLEEKAGMCSGKDFWHLKSVKRLGIPEVMVSDGPCGLRKQDMSGDHLGINESIKAVCFPSGCLTSCSFDPALLVKEGETIGDECQAEDVAVILGPAINIKRSPLCGRNFEYLSEDPYLAGVMGAAFVKGVQSKNIGTSVKHFAANSQEFRRMSCSSNATERVLREIYLPAFERTIIEGKPDTVMCSYNRINGVFASENKWLLTDVLRKEWGYKGYVVSDWGAVNNRVEGLKAGLDLEMPASGGYTDRQIVQAVKNGSLKESVLDKAVERILNIIFKYADDRREGNFDKEAHHQIVADIASESMVLLKNEKNILPLKEKDAGDILFVGVFADKPRYEGGGSAHINTWKVTSALKAAKKAELNVKYVPGFDVNEKKDAKLLPEALAEAKKAKTVVVFAGLPDKYESEGYDRTHMHLPENQDVLISEIAKVNKNVVVVLHNGSPVEMPWIDDVKAVLESYLAGESVGIAQIDLLFGKKNPCGKLAETFPVQLEDNPSYLNFPGDGHDVNYAEGIYVGYRYYDAKKMNVLFPFGHGLSYTSFEYSDFKLSSKKIMDTDTVEVSVKVTNTGKREGKEVVQFYVGQKSGTRVARPVKELKAFEKILLKPKESKIVKITLDKRAFSYFEESIGNWYAPSGDYEIYIGSSSRDLRGCLELKLTASEPLPMKVHENTVFEELFENPKAYEVGKPLFDKFIAGMMQGNGESKKEESAVSEDMMYAMMRSMPFRSLRSFAQLSDEEIAKIIKDINNALTK